MLKLLQGLTPVEWLIVVGSIAVILYLVRKETTVPSSPTPATKK